MTRPVRTRARLRKILKRNPTTRLVQMRQIHAGKYKTREESQMTTKSLRTNRISVLRRHHSGIEPFMASRISCPSGVGKLSIGMLPRKILMPRRGYLTLLRNCQSRLCGCLCPFFGDTPKCNYRDPLALLRQLLFTVGDGCILPPNCCWFGSFAAVSNSA